MTPAAAGRPGRVLGIDVGSVRIGVAVCDPDRILATPVETVTRTPGGSADVDRITALTGEYEAVAVVIGMPGRCGTPQVRPPMPPGRSAPRSPSRSRRCRWSISTNGSPRSPPSRRCVPVVVR